MENNMSAWIAVAYQGSAKAVQTARASLHKALEDGTYTAHDIAVVRPASPTDPALPPIMEKQGDAVFGFLIAEGVKGPWEVAPTGCFRVSHALAALSLGVGGAQ
jgi:hypothetical protein